MLAFLLLLFVCVAFAVKPCCFPAKMEGFVSSHAAVMKHHGRPHHSANLAMFSIDYKAKKLAASGLAFGGRHVCNYTVIADFAAKKLYLADKKRQRCHVATLKRAMPGPCAPLANSTFGASFMFGAGSGGMHLNSFMRMVHRRGARVGVISLVQDGNCVPVIEAAAGRVRRVAFHADKTFVNMQLKIKDPKVFTPPSYCKSNETESLMYIGGGQRGDESLGWQHELNKDDDVDVTNVSQLSDDLQFVMDFFSDESEVF